MSLDRNKLIAFTLAAIAAVLVYLLWPKAEEDAATVIQRKVIQMARAAERKDMGFINEQISESFHSPNGMGKQEIKGYLAGQVLRGTWVRVFVDDVRAEAQGDTGRMTGKFILGRSEAQSLKDLTRESVMGSYRVDAEARKEPDGEWRFTSATWKEESVF